LVFRHLIYTAAAEAPDKGGGEEEGEPELGRSGTHAKRPRQISFQFARKIG